MSVSCLHMSAAMAHERSSSVSGFWVPVLMAQRMDWSSRALTLTSSGTATLVVVIEGAGRGNAADFTGLGALVGAFGVMAAKGPGTSGSGEGFLAGGLSVSPGRGDSSLACFLPVMRVLLTDADAKFADSLKHLARSSADLSRSASSSIVTLTSFWLCMALTLDAIAESARDVAEMEDGARCDSKSRRTGVLNAVSGSIAGLFSSGGVASFGVP